MIVMRVTVLLLLTSWTVLDCHAASQYACEPGWFGSSCQYKCRCRNNRCSPQGDCPDGVACEEGWFGPACQYADLAYGAKTSQLTIIDGDDHTCLTQPGVDNVEIALNLSSHFTWLRIRLRNPDLLYNLTVRFRQNASLSCTNTRTARVHNTTLDIHCDLKETVDHVILSGEGVQYLCSVYISGGRNVALKGNVSQYSTYSEYSIKTHYEDLWYNAEKAVDGNRDTRFYEGNSCSHTAAYTDGPSFFLNFFRLQYITRFVLYNRNDSLDRLRHFELRCYNDYQAKVLDYKDNSTSGQPVYTVTPKAVATPIRLVNIEAYDHDKILTLCELEVYGDSICADGQYGRECEHTCNCDGRRPCLVSTGGCPSGCASGYQGENCKIPCSPGKHGPGCLTDCHEFCVKDINGVGSCDRFNGTCDLGCESGYRGSHCNLTCSPGKHGPGCLTDCHEFCVKDINGVGSCDRFNGTCDLGCESGYGGSHCNLTCSPGKHGPRCLTDCHEFCVKDINGVGSCDRFNGTCDLGCENGYRGSHCNLTCSAGKYGPGCLTDCQEFCVKDINGVRSCDRFNGTCDLGCESGYRGSRCNLACSSGKYGPGCLTDCHEFCVKDINSVRSCDRFNGTCDLGCESGYKGSHCNLLCEPGKYGPRCNNTCSQHCANQTMEEIPCDHVHGACRYGCQTGYKQPLCLSSCDPGKYGPRCGYNCSRICVSSNTTDQSSCHHVTGICMFGCHGGYDVQICDQDYGSPASPDNKQLIGITVSCLFGVIIMAVIIAAGIIVFRRCKTTESERRGDSLIKFDDNISLSRNDHNEIHGTLSDGGPDIPVVSAAEDGTDGIAREDRV